MTWPLPISRLHFPLLCAQHSFLPKRLWECFFFSQELSSFYLIPPPILQGFTQTILLYESLPYTHNQGQITAFSIFLSLYIFLHVFITTIIKCAIICLMCVSQLAKMGQEDRDCVYFTTEYRVVNRQRLFSLFRR